jgi:hypothetical protein
MFKLITEIVVYIAIAALASSAAVHFLHGFLGIYYE